MFTARFSARSKFYEKRLVDFYLPVFLYLEKYLYRDISLSEANEIIIYLSDMVEKHYMLVNDRLIEYVRLMKRQLETSKDYKDSFQSICEYVDIDLDYLQNKLGLPQRGFIYRLNNRQFRWCTFFSMNVFAEFFFCFFLPFLLLIFAGLVTISILK